MTLSRGMANYSHNHAYYVAAVVTVDKLICISVLYNIGHFSYLSDARLSKTNSMERLDAVTHRTNHGQPIKTSRHGWQNSSASRQSEIRHLQLQPLTQQPHKMTIGQVRQKSRHKATHLRDCTEVNATWTATIHY